MVAFVRIFPILLISKNHWMWSRNLDPAIGNLLPKS